jgi:hypothetical protein
VKRAALASCILVVIIGAVLWHARTTIQHGGPLSGGSSSSGDGDRIGVGQPFSFGGVVLFNRGSEPAVLERIRILGMTEGFEVLGVRTNPAPLNPTMYNFLGAFGFPPDKYPSHSLAEIHVVPVAKTKTKSGEPGEGLQLVIGAKATHPGIARARGVEFTYRVGHRRFRNSYDGSMYLCAPTEQFTAETCPGDAEGKFDNASAEVKIP